MNSISQQADCREAGIQTKWQPCNSYKDNKKSNWMTMALLRGTRPNWMLVGESKEEVNAPQFMDFAVADQLNSQSHFRFQVDPRESNLIVINKIIRYLKGLPTLGVKYPKDIVLKMFGYIDTDYAGYSNVQGSLMDQLPLQVLGEDTDPIAICQWSVSTSPGPTNLDVSADSGSDIDLSDESNKDGDLRTPIAPHVTSLRMAKVIFLAGTDGFWSYERSDTLVRMSVNMSGEKSETLVRKNEDKANIKNQKIRRKLEVCLQTVFEALESEELKTGYRQRLMKTLSRVPERIPVKV
ncbi:hypothetical protein AgCh_022700 [Apium graveolens]